MVDIITHTLKSIAALKIPSGGVFTMAVRREKWEVRMARFRKFAAVTLAAAMTLSMAACGSKDDDKKSTENTTAVTESTADSTEPTTADNTGDTTTTEAPGEDVVLEDDSPYYETVEIVKLEDGMEVVDVDFEDNKEDGFTTYTNGGSFTLGVKERQLVAHISRVGTKDYANQIYWDGFSLSKGAVYTYSFDAKSDIPRKIEWRLQMNGGDFHKYAGDYIDIGTEYQTYSFDIEMDDDSDPAPRLVFNMGLMEDMDGDPGEHNIYYDNVKLTVKDATNAQEIEPLPEPPRMNTSQIGYRPDDVKSVTISSKVINTFYVKNAETDEVVYTGKFGEPVDDTDTRNWLRLGDFSEVTEPGTYYIESGSNRTYNFVIGDGIYDDVYGAVVRMLYLQRCGCELDKNIAGDFAHEACHTGLATVYGGTEQKDVSGGWHDAGDYGRYVVAGAKTVEDLILAYEDNGEVNDNFGIPESGNGVPDVLDEARYELEWMLKMQDEATGGVYHKVTCLNFPETVLAVEETEELYLAPISYAATGDFVAVMCDASRVYADYDKEFADKCLEAAKKAWTYIDDGEKHAGYTNPEEIVTGEYGDKSIFDEQFWAAVSLYRATNDEVYRQAVNDYYKDFMREGLGWADVVTYAYYSLAQCDPTGIEDVLEKTNTALFAKADDIVKRAENNNYFMAVSGNYVWGSNMTVANNGMILLFAARLTGDEEKVEQYTLLAKRQLDYLFGYNSLGYCFVTGYGSFSPQHPHHRPSQVLGKAMPGMLAGGPNANLEDSYAKAVLYKSAPARCYADNEQAFSLNEVTIYWNSPLIYLLARFH